MVDAVDENVEDDSGGWASGAGRRQHGRLLSAEAYIHCRVIAAEMCCDGHIFAACLEDEEREAGVEGGADGVVSVVKEVRGRGEEAIEGAVVCLAVAAVRDKVLAKELVCASEVVCCQEYGNVWWGPVSVRCWQVNE